MNRRYAALILLPATLLIAGIAQRFPQGVEKFYSTGAYPVIAGVVSRLFARVPISVGELIVGAIAIAALVSLASIILRGIAWPARLLRLIASALVSVLFFASTVYFMFMISWGLNYHRSSFAEISGLEVEPASVAALADLCKYLIARTNEIRSGVEEDEARIMRVSGGDRRNALLRAGAGYKEASSLYPQLGGVYSPPKPVLVSRLMSYANIAGIYFPYTVEANVNFEVPDTMLPSTACHEMAHQRGFAREDEANYIAYLTCTMHPDTDFRYSGTLLALIHSMNALWRYDRDLYRRLQATYSEPVRRDLDHQDAFWRRFEGPIERASNKINDTYLKAQGQRDGTQSYGRMVDLLLAEHRVRRSVR